MSGILLLSRQRMDESYELPNFCIGYAIHPGRHDVRAVLLTLGDRVVDVLRIPVQMISERLRFARITLFAVTIGTGLHELSAALFNPFGVLQLFVGWSFVGPSPADAERVAAALQRATASVSTNAIYSALIANRRAD